MTYSISPATYRLGYSISWNVINSPLFFSINVRLNIVLNTFLKGMLKYFRIKLVKWVSHSESNYYKLVLVVLDASCPDFYKIRFKSKRLKFFAWNYLYYNKTTWKVVQLRDFYTTKRYRYKPRLGSGKFWHKFYKSLFFSLGKKFLHTRKLIKNANIDFEFSTDAVRSENSEILKANNLNYFNKIKYSWNPKYQFMFRFYFRLHLYLKKWSLFQTSTVFKSSFKFDFFIQLFLFNFFFKALIKKSKNEKLLRFYSRFININKLYYRASKRIVPNINFYFDAFNYIKGANYRWAGSGRIAQSTGSVKFFTPWSDSFSRGFLFNKSYKKIARRYVFSVFGEVKTTERIRLANYMIKNFVMKKKSVIQKLSFRKRLFFFHRGSFSRSLNRIIASMCFYKPGKKLFKRKIKIKRKIFAHQLLRYRRIIGQILLKKKRKKKNVLTAAFKNRFLFDLLSSNKYHYNSIEDSYMNRVGFLKIRSMILKRIRRSFLKKVKMNFFSAKRKTTQLYRKEPVFVFVKLLSLRKLKIFFSVLTRVLSLNLFKKDFVFQDSSDLMLLNTESISFFRKRKKVWLPHDPFSRLEDNFLLLLYNFNFLFLVEKRKEKKKVIGDYWALSNLKFPRNNFAKFCLFFRYYNTILALNLFLKKCNYLFRIQRSILLFRFYWNLEFYSVYYHFKARRHNFEKIFKRSRSNILITKHYNKHDASVFINFYQRPRNRVSRPRRENYFSWQKDQMHRLRPNLLLAYSSFIAKTNFHKNFYKKKHLTDAYLSRLSLIAPIKYFVPVIKRLFGKNPRRLTWKFTLFSRPVNEFLRLLHYFISLNRKKSKKKNSIKFSTKKFLNSVKGNAKVKIRKISSRQQKKKRTAVKPVSVRVGAPKKRMLAKLKQNKTTTVTALHRKFPVSKVLVFVHTLLKKKVKFFLKFYKINFYFIKPKARAAGFDSSFYTVAPWIPRRSVKRKKILYGLRLAKNRVDKSKSFNSLATQFNHQNSLFKRFAITKNKVEAVFNENIYLRYHQKYRHVWRNLGKYAASVRFFKNAALWENWFLRKFIFYLVPFFFKTVLWTRLNFFKYLNTAGLVNTSKEVFSFAMNRRYLYRIYAKFNKVFPRRPISTVGRFFLQLKKKIILQLLKLNAPNRFALQRSKFEFFKYKSNTNLFLTKSKLMTKRRLLQRKKPLNIVNKYARFQDDSIVKPKFTGKLSRKQRRWLAYKQILLNRRKKFSFKKATPATTVKKRLRVVDKRKQKIRLLFQTLNANVDSLLLVPNSSFGLKTFKLNYLKVIKTLLSRKDKLFVRQLVGKQLLNKVVHKNSLPISLVTAQTLTKFEKNKARAFSEHWKTYRYDHRNRFRKYFSKNFLNSLSSYQQKIIKGNYAFLKAFPRRFVLSFDFSYFLQSIKKNVERYNKNLNASLDEITYYLAENKVTSPWDKKNLRGKYFRKRSLPLRRRNWKLGRQNYFKYAAHNAKELKFEKTRLRRNRIKFKYRKFVYHYYRLQGNFHKQLIKAQAKLLAKNVFNAGSWLREQKQNVKMNLPIFRIPTVTAKLHNYQVLNWLLYRKKFDFNRPINLSHRELDNDFTPIALLRKGLFWSPTWQMYKRMYPAKFLLYRFHAKRIYSAHRNSYRVTMPLKRAFFTTSRQYKSAYLDKMQFAYMTTNRFFRKFRRDWLKDFFLKKDHLKIFYLYQKKIYYDLCLSQTEMVNKNLKAFVLKKMAKHKARLTNREESNKLLGLMDLRKEMVFFYRLAKNYILLNFASSRFQHFLNFFLQNLLGGSAAIRLKLAQGLNYRYNMDFRKDDVTTGILSKKFSISFYVRWFRKFILHTNKTILVPEAVNVSFRDKNLRAIDLKISEGNDVFKEEPWSVLYFGKFVRFFNLEESVTSYFNLFRWKKLKGYEPLSYVIELMFFYLYNFFTNIKNHKKILLINLAVAKIKKKKLIKLILVGSNAHVKCLPASLYFYCSVWDKPVYYYYYYLSFIKNNNNNIFRIRTPYHFNKNVYSTRFWLRNKKFLFWLEQTLENTFKINFKLTYISSVKAISKFYRSSTNFFHYTKRLKLHRLEGGWRQQTIYADVLWVILIAIKYYCASFLSNMISEQIVKRKKQWPFIKILKTTITQILPVSLMSNPVRVDGMKISINGKINGRDRSIHYLMSKLYKDLQKTKDHPIFLKVDYSLSFANSKYGVFGIKVWISRV